MGWPQTDGSVALSLLCKIDHLGAFWGMWRLRRITISCVCDTWKAHSRCIWLCAGWSALAYRCASSASVSWTTVIVWLETTASPTTWAHHPTTIGCLAARDGPQTQRVLMRQVSFDTTIDELPFADPNQFVCFLPSPACSNVASLPNDTRKAWERVCVHCCLVSDQKVSHLWRHYTQYIYFSSLSSRQYYIHCHHRTTSSSTEYLVPTAQSRQKTVLTPRESRIASPQTDTEPQEPSRTDSTK